MKILTKPILIDTQNLIEIDNITEDVRKIVRESGVQEGFVNVLTTHTTTTLAINEECPFPEHDLRKDFLWLFERIAPIKGKYKHNPPADVRPNAHSHLKALTFGQASITIPISNGELTFGAPTTISNGERTFSAQWQSIFFIELDGPRKRRKIVVQVVGE